MSGTPKAWIVRGGREPDRALEKYALGDGSDGFAIIGWHLPDLTGISNSEKEARGELKKLFTNAHPDVETSSRDQCVGSIFRFLQIRQNDIVVMPRGEYVAIGSVCSDYFYDDSFINEPERWPEELDRLAGRHRFPVKWKSTEVPRDHLEESVRSCLSNKSRPTVAQFDEDSAEWLRQFVDSPSEPGSVQALKRGGREYRAPTRQELDSKQTVFEIDPKRRTRGIRAHMDTQDKLKNAILSAGLEPRSPEPVPVDPQFDVAWRQGDTVFVAEVKSVTEENEERQLRLGLGQVLSYAHLLGWPGVENVKPVLAVERRPAAEHWDALCKKHDVILTWPEEFGGLFG